MIKPRSLADLALLAVWPWGTSIDGVDEMAFYGSTSIDQLLVQWMWQGSSHFMDCSHLPEDIMKRGGQQNSSMVRIYFARGSDGVTLSGTSIGKSGLEEAGETNDSLSAIIGSSVETR